MAMARGDAPPAKGDDAPEESSSGSGGNSSPLARGDSTSGELSMGESFMRFGENRLTIDEPPRETHAGIILNRVPTPEVQELAYGIRHLYHGDMPLAYGAPPPFPTRLEEIIVRAAWEMSIPAYNNFQPGARPVLPSVIFRSTSVAETDSFDRGLNVQYFEIEMRAKLLKDVIALSERYYAMLRVVAGNRFKGLGGQWSDEYLPGLNYRVRAFSIGLQK